MQKELEEILAKMCEKHNKHTWYCEDDLVEMFDGKIKTAEEELLIGLGRLVMEADKMNISVYAFDEFIEKIQEINKSLREEQK